MTVRFADGAERTDTASRVYDVIVSPPSRGAANGRFGGACWQLQENTTKSLEKWLDAFADDEWYCTWAFRTSAFDVVAGNMMDFKNSDGSVQIRVAVNAAKQLTVWRGAGVTLLATGTTVFANDTWYSMQIYVKCADAGGVVQIRLGGQATDEINFAGDTKAHASSTLISRFLFVNGMATGGTSFTYFDDIVLADSLGAQTWLPDCRILPLAPNGNGNSSGLTGSDGNSVDNYLLVDDGATSDEDATYVAGSVAGTRDTYALPAMPVTPASIVGVMVTGRMRKDDAGARSARVVTRSGGVDYESADIALADGYLNYTDLRLVDPATGVAWTEAGVNALEAGVKVQT